MVEIRFTTAMFKRDFAESYYGVSLETLRKWMNRNEELQNELDKIAYNKRSKKLKPTEMELIRKYI